MKECCKTGNEIVSSKLKIWVRRIFWGIVISLVIGIAIVQIFNL
jgi:hypothetical protein